MDCVKLFIIILCTFHIYGSLRPTVLEISWHSLGVHNVSVIYLTNRKLKIIFGVYYTSKSNNFFYWFTWVCNNIFSSNFFKHCNGTKGLESFYFKPSTSVYSCTLLKITKPYNLFAIVLKIVWFTYVKRTFE